MSDNQRIKVAICWHMHQPQYNNALTNQYELPWTYLHTIKDYVDMVAFLEACPAARVTVNFAPILLEQIDDYAKQVSAYINEGESISDPLLAALAEAKYPSDMNAKLTLMKHCLRLNEDRLVNRFPVYRQLADMVSWLTDHGDALPYVSDEFLTDLLVWYHLAWLGETVRRDNAAIQVLIDKAQHFDVSDRRTLIQLIQQLLTGVIARYRQLQDNGQIEIAFSPYAHPIVPLLFDFQSAREAMPDVELPSDENYPGGASRVAWHMEKGMEVYETYFGCKPRGCWPSEGGLSNATLAACERSGLQWVASGESVMRNSAARGVTGVELDQLSTHRLFKVAEHETTCFFRDDGLSDLIGFTYSTWHADDAVGNLISHLETIANSDVDRADIVVPIILDGENAWEHYPENGYYFLTALYEQLSQHDTIEMATFTDCIQAECKPVYLNEIVAGSWVYGTFSTWIGDHDKNRGWDLLCEAKRAYDKVVNAGLLTRDSLLQVEKQLAICEGSDWFWWFGDYNPSASVKDFDRLYRLQLTRLYQLLNLKPPESLQVVVSKGGDVAPAVGGVMRPGKEA